MSEMKGQEHAITFTEVDLKNDGFITYNTLCVGDNFEEGLKFFNQIKEYYPKHVGEPEMVIDFINTNWEIIDDFPLTKENARHLAMRMGHVLKVDASQFDLKCAVRRMSKKEVAWFSGGVSSFIDIYLKRDTVDEIFYIDIDDQHPDTIRFLTDCEKALGKQITILRSDKFKTVEEVISKTRYVNGPSGARCTLELKKKVRQDWEKQQEGEMVYIWGYDSNEKHRSDRLKEGMPEYEHIFPLIDEDLSKEEVHGMLQRLGIKRPEMYELGYRNNNCIGCVKGGMGYWNKIRKDFPHVFEERAKLEREIGRSCIKGIFLDELDPDRGRIEDEVMEECGIMCEIAYEKMEC